MKKQNSGSGFAMLVAGVAAGVLGSRMLPPLLANMNGAARARKGGDPFELLIEDHRKIESLIDSMAQEPTSSNLRRASQFIMLKRKLGKHALAEEDVVYPIPHGQGEDAAGSKDLYEDHADIKILLFEMEQLLMNGADWSDPATRLRDLIREHVREEEQVVFPKLRQMMDQERTPVVAGQIRREEALVL